jgi:hypothetical protein
MNIQISGSPSRVKLDKLDKKTFASSKFDFLEALRCNPKISDLEYRLISEILQCADGLGRTRPISDEQLALGTGHPWRSLWRARVKLRDRGYLTWERAYRTRNTYRVDLRNADVQRRLNAKRSAKMDLKATKMTLASVSSKAPRIAKEPAKMCLNPESITLASVIPANRADAGERHSFSYNMETSKEESLSHRGVSQGKRRWCERDAHGKVRNADEQRTTAMTVIEIDGRWHVVEGTTVLHRGRYERRGMALDRSAGG